jgi:hypothetical protein
MRTACTPEVWTALTDTTSLHLTRLEADVECRMQAGWLQRQVRLQLQAQWPQETERTLLVQRTIPLRNHLPSSVQRLYCP